MLERERGWGGGWEGEKVRVIQSKGGEQRWEQLSSLHPSVDFPSAAHAQRSGSGSNGAPTEVRCSEGWDWMGVVAVLVVFWMSSICFMLHQSEFAPASFKLRDVFVIFATSTPGKLSSLARSWRSNTGTFRGGGEMGQVVGVGLHDGHLIEAGIGAFSAARGC